MKWDQDDAEIVFGETISVSKKEAAIRQLNVAIRLWFGDEDPISIHTLAHSSHEILHRLYRNAGHSNLMFDSSEIPSDPKAAREYIALLKDPSRYFKHANVGEEIDGAFSFNPGLNYLYMMMSVIALQKLGEEMSDLQFALLCWSALKHPKLFSLENQFAKLIPVHLVGQVKAMTRPDFLDKFSQLRSKGVI